MEKIIGLFHQAPEQLPTRGEPDGALCGNGDIGLVVGGSPEFLQYWIGKNDIWRAKPHQIGGGARSFGWIGLEAADLAGAEYYAEQHIDRADVVTEMRVGEHCLRTESYVDRNQNLLVHKLINKGAPLNISLHVYGIRGNEDVEDFVYYHVGTEQYESSGREAVIHESVNGNTLFLSKAFRGPDLDFEVEACALTAVLGKESTAFTLGEGETVLLATAIFTNFDSPEGPEAACHALIAQVDEAFIEKSRAAHEVWWADFWATSRISIPSEKQIERFWYASHYLLACCCKTGKFAPGLYGAWVTSDEPNWGGDYHMDYNHQAPWWGVFSSNKVFLADPYDTPLLDFIPVGEKYARELLGVRGNFQMIGIGPLGCEIGRIYNSDGSFNPHGAFWGQKSDAVFAAVNMAMRYFTTYDEEYARKVLPYLLSAADFWEDYLEFEDGRYVIYNDYAGENGWALSDPERGLDKHSPKHDFNPLISLAFLRTTLRCLLEIVKELGVYEDRAEKWRHILEHLSEFPTHEANGKTVFRRQERSGSEEKSHRKNVGTSPIFPGDDIGFSSPPELLKIARDSFEEAVEWTHYNACPLYYPMAARVGHDANEILKHLNEQIETHAFPNFFIYYGGGGIECCSMVPSCVNELFVQSHQGQLRFFPAWAKDKDASFERLRTYGAFLVSGEFRDGEVQEITLESEKGRRCTVISPWREGLSVYCEGRLVPVTDIPLSTGMEYRFRTKAGKVYTIVKGSRRV